jgi:hypothetical protein
MMNSCALAWEMNVGCIISCLTTTDNQWSSITKYQHQKNSRLGVYSGKIMLRVLWDFEGKVHSEFMSTGLLLAVL